MASPPADNGYPHGALQNMTWIQVSATFGGHRLVCSLLQRLPCVPVSVPLLRVPIHSGAVTASRPCWASQLTTAWGGARWVGSLGFPEEKLSGPNTAASEDPESAPDWRSWEAHDKKLNGDLHLFQSVSTVG